MASRPRTPARTLDPDAGLDAIVRDGYRVIAPVERDGTVVYDAVASADELPRGLTAELGPGRWRATHDTTGRRFAWTPGADSWKRFVLPPDDVLLTVRRRDGTFAVTATVPSDPPLAVVAARDCELRALAVLDRVLADPAHPDPRYVARRSDTFVVAVTCGEPSATCWCTSMGGGPEPRSGFDVRLTELHDADGHRLLAEAGSDRGRDLLDAIDAIDAPPTDLAAATAVAAAATARLPRRIDGASLPDRLAGTDQHAHWDAVARRCLSCGNCTLVCPTCFCTRIEDRTGLPGSAGGGTAASDAERRQRWASCFELDHSNLVGHPVRATTAARYRQWLTHKLQTWPAQFGTAGCVGCGRCTTWCPAGIDIVEETRSLMATGR